MQEIKEGMPAINRVKVGDSAPKFKSALEMQRTGKDPHGLSPFGSGTAKKKTRKANENWKTLLTRSTPFDL
jgi:hypothetical protein